MTECILWSKSKDRDGYGQIVSNGKHLKAHRLAYAQANNLSYDDLKGQIVRHKCDTPSCINPEHLELGSHQDNMDDRRKRGRTARGVKHGRAVLTDEDVANIRKEYVKRSSTHGCPALALKYNVHLSTIHKIVNHLRW